jgi:hypothetical protein
VISPLKDEQFFWLVGPVIQALGMGDRHQIIMKILAYFGEYSLFPNGRMPQMIQMQQMPNGYGYLPSAVELPQVAYTVA